MPSICRIGRRSPLIVYFFVAGVALIISGCLPDKTSKRLNFLFLHYHENITRAVRLLGSCLVQSRPNAPNFLLDNAWFHVKSIAPGVTHVSKCI